MDSCRDNKFYVKSVGRIANILLSKNQSFTVFSLITRGVFLLLSNEKMVFLSFEDKCGPLKLNLSGKHLSKPRFVLREDGQINSTTLIFDQSNTCISLDHSKIWEPPNANSLKTNIDRLDSRLMSMIKRILGSNNPSLLKNYLYYSTGVIHNNECGDNNEKINLILSDVQFQISRTNFITLANTLKPLLGWGRGLTPSGDDFIIGVILTLNRWGHIFHFHSPIKYLNQEIIRFAYKMTTTISANLIECATMGAADERIIRGLDYLILGNDDELQVIRNFSEWGNSSGFDTFVGIATTLLALCQ